MSSATSAGHAYRGMTTRIPSLFLERGHAYVYLAYGSSYMLNVSSEMPGIGAGGLIRALEPRDGIPIMQRNRQIERLRGQAGSRWRSYQAAYSSTIAYVAGCVVTSSTWPSPITHTLRPSRRDWR